MKLYCIIVLFITTKNVCSNIPSSPLREKRQIQPKLKQDQGRHRISEPVPFPAFTEINSKQMDCFPKTEYPTSVLDSKPFFYKSNDILEPFQDDVKSSFKSILEKTNKPKILPTMKPKSVKFKAHDEKEQNQKQTQELKLETEQEYLTGAALSKAPVMSKDKSEEYVDYDFDYEMATLAEFTSVEQPVYTHDVNSQMISDDMFSDVSEEINFNPVGNNSQEQNIFPHNTTENTTLSSKTMTYKSSTNFEDQVPAPMLLSEMEEPIIFG